MGKLSILLKEAVISGDLSDKKKDKAVPAKSGALLAPQIVAGKISEFSSPTLSQQDPSNVFTVNGSATPASTATIAGIPSTVGPKAEESLANAGESFTHLADPFKKSVA